MQATSRRAVGEFFAKLTDTKESRVRLAGKVAARRSSGESSEGEGSLHVRAEEFRALCEQGTVQLACDVAACMSRILERISG